MYEDNDANNIDCSECDIDSQNKIKLRLLEIQIQNNLDNLDLGFYKRKNKLKSISLHQAQERFDVYKNISKLGLYIINDYEFFFKITIQSAFKNEVYNTAMQNLGYQRSGSSWNLVWKPSQDIIIDYIYKYCYYAFILAVKNNQKRIPDDKMKDHRDFTMGDLLLNNFQSFINLSNFKRHSSKIIIPDQCPYCDTKLDINDYRCSACLALIEDMPKIFEESNQSHNTSEVTHHKERIERSHSIQSTDPHKNQNGYGESKLKDEDIEHFTTEDNDFNNQIPQYNETTNSFTILSNNIDKWLCSQCECLNSFGSLNCQGCQLDIKIKSGYWMCQACHVINIAQLDSCSTCNAKNVELDKYQKSDKNHENCINEQKKNQDKVKSKQTPITWACWNTNCMKQNNKENDTFCPNCKLQKEAPQFMSDLVKCYQGGVPCDFWFCQKCQKKNISKDLMCAGKNCHALRFYANCTSDDTVTKPPVIDKQFLNHDGSNNISNLDGDRWPCKVCTFMNEKELSQCKICDKPKKEGKNKKTKKAKDDHPDTWQCWYRTCHQMNASEHGFCQSCHLSRYENKGHGSAIEYQYKEVKKLIWICPTCNTFNDLGNTECKKRYCQVKRFEKEK